MYGSLNGGSKLYRTIEDYEVDQYTGPPLAQHHVAVGPCLSRAPPTRTHGSGLGCACLRRARSPSLTPRSMACACGSSLYSRSNMPDPLSCAQAPVCL
eukprot:4704178-Prymnesium_polylepis.1